MASSSPILRLLAASLAIRTAMSAAPVGMTWSTTPYGPDGPWQGVVVAVGTPPQQVTLYPGGAYDSDILTNAFCAGASNSNCQANAAGLFDPDNSDTFDNYTVFADQGAFWEVDAVAPMNITGSAELARDNLTFKSSSTTYNIPEFIFSTVTQSEDLLPNGETYRPWLGNLALGSPTLTQNFGEGNGQNVYGQLLTGNLRSTGVIPSSSFGLHIGSVPFGQVGSLILGGYDASRIIGTTGVFDRSASDSDVVPMIDLSIGVETGASPFNSSIPSSFFAPYMQGNSSVSMIINPTIPYMFFPPGVCESLASVLPVTVDIQTGLYLWNTASPSYSTIVNSPAYLLFTFQESLSQNLTIKVPFPLLNLTLESPLHTSTVPYFPCKTWESPNAHWELGRAFLQAAFFGINWEQAQIFLAQAPGPNAGPASISPIQPTDRNLTSSSSATFAQTWSRTWKALTGPGATTTTSPAGSAPTGTTSPSTSPGTSSAATPSPSSSSGSGSSGLSGGAIAGIVIGVLAGVILLTLLAFFLVRRRRRTAQPVAAEGYNTSAYAQHDKYVPPGAIGAPQQMSEAPSGMRQPNELMPKNGYYGPPGAGAEVHAQEASRATELP